MHFSPPPSGRPSATPATSLWLVIGDLPGEDDDERRKLEQFKDELKQVVENKVRDCLGPHSGNWVITTKAGIAESKKLRIFVDQI